jgi:hypothetical protein
MVLHRSLNLREDFRFILFDCAVWKEGDILKYSGDRACYIHHDASYRSRCIPPSYKGLAIGVCVEEYVSKEFHVIELVDAANGNMFLWWRSILNGHSMVENYFSFGLSSRAVAARALALLADIVMIGDLILEYKWGDVTEHYLRTMKVYKGITKTAEMNDARDVFCFQERALSDRVEVSWKICNLIYGELHLKDWIRENDDRMDFPIRYVDSRAQKYSCLFFLVALGSGLFIDIDYDILAQDIISGILKEHEKQSAIDAAERWMHSVHMTDDDIFGESLVREHREVPSDAV